MTRHVSGVTFRNGHVVVDSDVRQEFAHVEGQFMLVERDQMLDNDVPHLVGSYAECVTYRDALVAHHEAMSDPREFDIEPYFSLDLQ